MNSTSHNVLTSSITRLSVIVTGPKFCLRKLMCRVSSLNSKLSHGGYCSSGNVGRLTTMLFNPNSSKVQLKRIFWPIPSSSSSARPQCLITSSRNFLICFPQFTRTPAALISRKMRRDAATYPLVVNIPFFKVVFSSARNMESLGICFSSKFHRS